MATVAPKDIDILKQIEENAKLIIDIYRDLYFEEYLSGVKTKDYYECLKGLVSLREKEKTLYECLELTPDRANKIIGFLIMNASSVKRYDDRILDAINSPSTESIILNRMISGLEKELYKEEEDYKKWLLSSGILLTEKSSEEAFLNTYLESIIKRDCEEAFLRFNKVDILSSERDKYLRRKIKYNLLSLSPDTEERFLDYAGIFPEDIYFSFPYISEKRKIDRPMIISTQEDEGLRILNTALVNLVHFNDTFDINSWGAPIYQAYFKVGLSLLLPFSYYDDFINDLEEQVYSFDRESNSNCTYSLNGILDTISEFEEDVPKCKYLHFYPQK